MEGRESGVVKAWIDERGMGFITPAAGGLDHFVHRSMLTDGQSLQIGATVTYVPTWDAQKDKPIANQVQGASPAPGGGMGAGQAWAAPAAVGPPPPGYENGVVKAWIDARGMGFITPDGGTEDLFVHRSYLADGVSLVIGSTVQYTPSWDEQKAKAIAQNVKGASQVAQGPPAGKGGGGGAWDGGKGGGGKDKGSGDNLYIAGLPADATDESIRQIFGQYGVVSRCKVLPDNGSPARVALVQMGAPEQAEWLVWNLDGNIPLGLEQVVQVKYHAGGGGKGGAPAGAQSWQAPAQQWQAPAQQWGAPKGGAAPPPTSGDNLYISGLPLDTTTESVMTLLGQYGTITSAKVLESPGKPDKVAMVRMGSTEEAKWLLENLNGNIPAGSESVISIKYATTKQPADKGAGKGGYGAAPADPWGGKGWAAPSPYGKGGGKPAQQAWVPQNVPPPGQAWGAAPHVPKNVPPPPPQKKDKLQIAGLPADSSEESVMGLIGQYGAINHVKMLPQSGPSRTAIVQMGDEESAKWLLETLNGNIPQGIETPVQITYATAQVPPSGAAYFAAQPQAASGPNTGAWTTGSVKHWVEDRGMGFITPSEGGQDCFVHRSDLVDGLSLVLGAQVSFQLGWDNLKAKPTAVQVTGATGGEGVGKGAHKPTKGGGKGLY